MCGIAGSIGPSTSMGTNGADLVSSMLQAMHHRGPDQHGLWEAKGADVALGHRRLSILDLSEAGRQPMTDSTSGIVLTYNGECYNYLELQDELRRAGHSFHSSSDTEVILKAYLEWGADFITRLRGMFAFALWDPKRRETLLVRDRLGIKPVYYTQAGATFLFASEVRALLATGQVARTLNPHAVSTYLWHGFIPGPDTIVRDIKRLAPGTLLRVDADGRVIEERQYWQLPSGQNAPPAEDAVALAQAELARASAEHLASDVPLGVFLSGGVDSSAVAALAQRSAAHAVMTYNIRFDEPDYDESSYAREVAQRLGTAHQELTLTESMFADQLEDALSSLDQPTFDAINTYFVSRAVREAGLTVALAGTGGDELFGGYSSFRDLPKACRMGSLAGYLPAAIRRAAGSMGTAIVSRGAGEVRPQVRWGKIADLLATQGDLVSGYQVSYALFNGNFLRVLDRSGATGMDHGLRADIADGLRGNMGEDQSMLEQISSLELFSFLGERLLPDTDSASMAASLEVRVPLLDHQFIESLAGLTTAQRYHPVGRKAFLRDAVKAELDPRIFDRPKAGFELPLEKWCRARLAPELDATFRDINLAHSIGLDAECVVRLWRAFSADAPGLYWSRLWSIFVLMTWCKQHKVTLG